MKSTKTSIEWKIQTLPFAAALVLFSILTAGAVDYPTTILADHPIAYYRLEETSGSVAADSSTTGLYPGNYVASGSYPLLGQPGITTNSISLSSAQSSSVTIGYYSDLNQPGPFSFEIWARPISAPTGGNYRCPIGNSPAFNVANLSGWYVYQTPSPGSTLALVTPTGVFITYAGYTLFNWYHLAGTYDGTNMSFYVNGTLVGTQNASGYEANSVHNAGVNVIGLGQRGDGYGIFDGGLDEAAFYTNVLSPAQILNHYQVGTNSFRVAPLPPSVLTDPASTTNYAGQTVQFSVLADGTAPLYYQWYKGTSLVGGATNSAYSFTTVPSDDATTYSVVVTNFVGSITSQVANLTVSTGLLIDAPLTSIIRNVGSSAAFEIVAEGAQPIFYQWRNGDASAILGATNSTLWLTNLNLTNDGATYYVSITNPYTSIDSGSATLNVQARPVTNTVFGYAKVVLADEPTAYWQLDETNSSLTAVDTVGSFDGTYLPGAGSFTYGVTNGIPHDTNAAVSFAGGATVSIPFAIEINPLGAFTVEGWFKPASVTTGGNDYRTAISSMSNPYGIGPSGWLVYQTAGNNWAWWPYNGFYTGIQLNDPDQIVPNQWYYLTLVYDTTNFILYVNGVAKASGADPGFLPNGNVPPGGTANYNYNYNTTPGLPIGSGAFTLAQRVDNGFGPFLGTVDNVAVYNKALTPLQIQNHLLNTTHLFVTSSGSKTVVTWPVGTLQSSTNVAGPYTNVIGAVSPFTNSTPGAARFFRAQLQ